MDRGREGDGSLLKGNGPVEKKEWKREVTQGEISRIKLCCVLEAIC